MGLPFKSDEARRALAECRPGMVGIAVLSFAIAMLPVALALFMLLMFDTAIPGHSIATVTGLTAIMLSVIGVICYLSILRRHMLCAIGAIVSRNVMPRLEEATARIGEDSPSGASDGMQISRDLDAIQEFLASRAATAWIDIAGLPIFLIVIALLHGWLALATLIIAAIMAIVLWRTVEQLDQPARDMVTALARRHAISETGRMNAGLIRALGLRGQAVRAWVFANGVISRMRMVSAGVHIRQTEGSRTLQFILFTVLLAAGSAIASGDKADAAVVMTAAVFGWLATEPICIAISQAPSFIAARQGWARIDIVLHAVPTPPPTIRLPTPQRTLECQGLAISFAGTGRPAVYGITFSLAAGNVLTLVGPEGSGKSTILAGLVGARQLAAGKVRIDGAALDQWDSDQLGGQIGYLPQTVDLLDGTVAENIARFDPDADPSAVVQAAQTAGVHDLIVHLPNGYNTLVGWNGRRLSRSQAQRIGLARALYGNPFLVVLDEPTAYLDPAGEKALIEAVEAARARGAVILLAGAASSLVNMATHVMVVHEGTMAEFGEKERVRQRIADKRSATEIEQRKTSRNKNSAVNTATTSAEPGPAATDAGEPIRDVPR